jgi:hypothetical protein
MSIIPLSAYCIAATMRRRRDITACARTAADATTKCCKVLPFIAFRYRHSPSDVNVDASCDRNAIPYLLISPKLMALVKLFERELHKCLVPGTHKL